MTVTDDAPDTSSTRAALSPAEAAMVEANLPLVRWAVNKWHARDDEFEKDEKYADGVLGLMRAAQKFDPEKGFTFSTYAIYWIRSAIQRGTATFEGSNFRRANPTNGNAPLGIYVRPQSLDRPVSREDDTTVGDLLADTTVDVEGRALSEANAQRMQTVLIRACKDPVDLAIVEFISTGEPIAAVARRLGESVQMLQFRRERLLAKVRHPTYGLVARIPKAKEAAMTDTALARLNGTTAYACPEPDCTLSFETPQGLGSHRRYNHGGAGLVRDASRGPSRTGKPARPVEVGLVDEQPPEPAPPPMKPFDEILATVEAAELEAGKWQRVALFVSSRAAKAMATKLRKHTEGGPYEWLAPGDDRLFVRVKADA